MSKFATYNQGMYALIRWTDNLNPLDNNYNLLQARNGISMLYLVCKKVF